MTLTDTPARWFLWWLASLARSNQQQFKHAASTTGLTSELMAAVAAWFTESQQYSSSSSEGSAAGSDAAADCLSTVCAALLLLTNVYASVDPMSRSRQGATEQKLRRFTGAEEIYVAGFFLMVGLRAVTLCYCHSMHFYCFLISASVAITSQCLDGRKC